MNTGRSILAAVALHALDNVASVLASLEGAELLVRLALVTGLATAVSVAWGRERSVYRAADAEDRTPPPGSRSTWALTLLAAREPA